MATVITIRPEHTSGLYDSATERSVITEKVVDVTDDCPKAAHQQRCFLLFARTQRGRICQVVRPYAGETWMGTQIHFFIDERHPSTFESTADNLGLSATQLQQLIELHAPA